MINIIDIILNWSGIGLFVVGFFFIMLFVVKFSENSANSNSSFASAYDALNIKDLDQAKAILINRLKLDPRDVHARLLLDRVMSCQDKMRVHRLTGSRQGDESSDEQADNSNILPSRDYTYDLRDRRMNAFHGHKTVRTETVKNRIDRMYRAHEWRLSH